MKAPIWASVTLPEKMLVDHAAPSRSSVRFRPSMIWVRLSRNMIVSPLGLFSEIDAADERHFVRRFSQYLQKIPQQPFAHRGHDRFRVELDAFGGVLPVADAHDLAVLGLGA